MAKKNYSIASISSAVRGEIKETVEAPVIPEPAAEPEKTATEEVLAEKTSESATPAPVVPVVAPQKRERGRPRKTEADAEERNAFVRAIVTPSMKEKLHIICRQKNVSENDYTYELLKKAINRDYEQCVAEMFSTIK